MRLKLGSQHMNENQNILNYSSNSSWVEDKNMALIIQQNLNFVLNYMDDVEKMFKKPFEKQIAYRELGSIVLSCIEALAKTLIDCFKKRCFKRDCDEREDCEYMKFPDEKGSAREALQYLFDVRLFRLSPDEFDELKQLYELRNYIHISKNISEKNADDKFNIDFVKRTLDYYYAFIDQLDLVGDYFLNNSKCLKILDENGIKYTKQQNKSEQQLFYFMKIIPVVSALLRNVELNDDDEWVLDRINHREDVNFEELIDYIKEMVKHHKIKYKTDEEYENVKNTFKVLLLKYVTKDKYIKRINDEI